MAHLDRFLNALVTNRATQLILQEGQVAHLEIGGVGRPITKQPFSAAQLRTLLREVAPARIAAQLEGGGEVRFEYASADGVFAIVAARRNGSFVARARLDDGTRAPTPPSESAVAEKVSGPTKVVVASGGKTPGKPSGPALAVVDDGTLMGDDSADDAALNRVERLLTVLHQRKASDLHLRVGEPPILRADGEIIRLEGEAPLDNGEIEAMLQSIMPDRNKKEYEELNDTDFAYEIGALSRFRCNALRERRGAAAVFRAVPARTVTVEELGLAEEVQRLCFLSKGLVLVTGPTGSGKSTTLCALVDLVNRERSDHVITIEDPIEFVHQNKRCLITQRHVGVHTSSFKHALRAALREDPDIVLVGELRDLETVSIAIETAETGHLVFGTLHTTSAVSTVERLIDQFPADRQEQIRLMLAESLKGVISQTLLKRIGGGRVAAREVLLSMPSVSNLIREGKTFQLQSVMQTSRRHGMVTLNDALLELVDTNQVEPREAYLKAIDKLGFANLIRQRGHQLDLDVDVEGSAAHPESAKGAPKADSLAKGAPRKAPAGR